MFCNNNILRPIALIMALLLGFTSFNYALDLHYCQGQLKSFSFFGKAKNCHEMAAAKASCHHSKVKEDNNTDSCSEDQTDDCCKNHTVKVEADDSNKLYKNIHSDHFEIDTYIISPLSTDCLNKVVIEYESKKVYKPPLIKRDYQSLYEIFLL